MPFSAYGGNWQTYEDALFEVYLRRLVQAGLHFKGSPLSYRKAPPHKGKHAGFWHLTSEGPDEQTRTPDLARCERMPWVPYVIAEADTANGVSGPVRWYDGLHPASYERRAVAPR